MAHIISPSFLSADFANLSQDIEMINQSKAEWFHLDVMDGVFVPNISFGMSIIKRIGSLTNKVLDVHLMIVNPEKFISEFKSAGANILTVHYEACTHLHRTVQEIKDSGMKAGVALNPHTPVHNLVDVIKDLDMVLIMSVNPGFGGQSFIENTFKKVKELKELINSTGSSCLIQVDGGVNDKNAKLLLEAGVDVLVAGNYIFKSDNALSTIESMYNL